MCRLLHPAGMGSAGIPPRAIMDRLTFNGTIIETGTRFYRLATTKASHGT